MVEGIIWLGKAIILTETLANAARSWGIFDALRDKLKNRVPFIRRLLDCFECTSVWAAIFVLLYLMYFEVLVLTYVLIFSRLACFLHVAWDYADAARAVKEKEI